jgi:hypothetical protein
VSSPGVTTFPLVSGDTVATSAAPAVLTFRDGSTVKLAENSSVRIATAGVNENVVLLAGALDYKLFPGSNVKVMNSDMLIKSTSAGVAVPSTEPSHNRITSVVSSPSFLISAGGSAVGLASAMLNPFSSGVSAGASQTSSGTLIAHLPPVSKHL